MTFAHKLVWGYLGLLLLLNYPIYSQNLDQFDKKQGLDINGSILFNQIFYQAQGLTNRRDPWTWYLSGNLNVQLLGYDAPFSFQVSNARQNFTQPFNQIRFNPRYKWAQLYTGYSQMNFSPYTLGGHVFFGAGLELKPNNWEIALMYGRLRQAVPFSATDSTSQSNASYKRMGWAWKLGYRNAKNLYQISYFQAQDDPSSLDFIPRQSNLSPQENRAISFLIHQKVIANTFLELEYAVSWLQRNRNVALNRQSDNFLNFIFPNQGASETFDAIKLGLSYQKAPFRVSLKYERVAPDYQSLGAYYFNNDFRNITLNPDVQLFAGKLILSASAGWQVNNLDQSRASTTERWVSQVNAQWSPNIHWQVQSSYSNFSTFTNQRPAQDPLFQNELDSLNFYQINHTFQNALLYNWGKTKQKNVLSLQTSFQKNREVQSQTPQASDSRFYSVNLLYSMTNTQSQNTYSLAVNYYDNRFQNLSSRQWGPTVSWNRPLIEQKLRMQVSSTYNQNLGSAPSQIWSSRLGFQWSPRSPKSDKKAKNQLQPSIRSNINFLRRFGDGQSSPTFSELTATVAYQMRF